MERSTMFSGQITHYKWAIFNSYVKLPEGMTFQKQKREWNNIPTVTHSFIFQMGRYTTNHCFPYKNSIRKLIRLPVWHYILSDFKPTRKSSWEVFPYVPMNWWTVQMILCFLSWAWEPTKCWHEKPHSIDKIRELICRLWWDAIVTDQDASTL